MNEVAAAVVVCLAGAVLLIWAVAGLFTANTLKETQLQVDTLIAKEQGSKKRTTLSLVEEDSVMKGNPDLYSCYGCRAWFHHRSYCTDTTAPNYCPLCGGEVEGIVIDN